MVKSAARVAIEWGRGGARRAAARGDIVVVVDVLSFSTTVSLAAARGSRVLPCASAKEARQLAARHGAIVAAKRGTPGAFSLSPLSVAELEPCSLVALESLNGATCCALAAAAPALYVGGLVNARATALALAGASAGQGITLLACGERWGSDASEPDEAIRFALEDWLGVGAIAAGLAEEEGHRFALSPEAAAAAASFRASEGRLEAILRETPSGLELQERGYGGELAVSAELDSVDCAVVRSPEGWLEARNVIETDSQQIP
jgi:2-phosphosulfolactate phosphatase